MTDADRPNFNGNPNHDAITVRDYFEARLRDMEIRLQQRFDAQEKSVTTAMIAAEKAVNAALTAAEKAVDKAEQAQALRNIVANEFRGTLADQNATMWPIKEGQAAVAALATKFEDTLSSLRRETDVRVAGYESRVHALESGYEQNHGRIVALETIDARLHMLENAYPTLTERASKIDDILARLASLEKAAATAQGKSSAFTATWSIGVLIASIALNLILHFWH